MSPLTREAVLTESQVERSFGKLLRTGEITGEILGQGGIAD